MKRDMDLVRQILIDIEQHQKFKGWIDLDIEDHSSEEVQYHVALLSDAGLIIAISPQSQGFGWKPVRLTWEGHEFLDASRDINRWIKVKEIMAKTGGFVYEIAKALLIDLAKAELKQFHT